MTVKFALSAIILAVLVSTGQGLKCNVCLGSLTSDCATGKPGSSLVFDCEAKSVTQKNAFPFLDIPEQPDQNNVVQCIQLILKDKNYEKPIVLRECAYGPPNICQHIGSSEKCKACKDKDLCNNQPIGK